MTTQLLAMLRLVAFGLASLFGFSNPSTQLPAKHEINPGVGREARQGWTGLLPCAETTSLDGNWSLSLSAGGKAELVDRIRASTITGSWELAAQDHVYRIDVLAFANDFEVVPSAAGCVLASGSLRRADLSQSWFARPRRAGELVAAASGLTVKAK